MQRSEFKVLQEIYSSINEAKNPHHSDGINLSKREVRDIQRAIHSKNNNI